MIRSHPGPWMVEERELISQEVFRVLGGGKTGHISVALDLEPCFY